VVTHRRDMRSLIATSICLDIDLSRKSQPFLLTLTFPGLLSGAIKTKRFNFNFIVCSMYTPTYTSFTRLSYNALRNTEMVKLRFNVPTVHTQSNSFNHYGFKCSNSTFLIKTLYYSSLTTSKLLCDAMFSLFRPTVQALSSVRKIIFQ